MPAARDIAIVTPSRRGFDDYKDKQDLIRQATSKGYEVDKRRLAWLRGQKKWALSSGVRWDDADEKELKEAEALVKNPPKRKTSGVRDLQPVGDAAKPTWLPEGRHQEDLNSFHDRLTSAGYKYDRSEKKTGSARHYYRHKTGPDAIINEYWKGGSTLTSMTTNSKASDVVQPIDPEQADGRARDFGIGPVHGLAGGETYKGCAIVRLPSGRYYVKTPNLKIETGLTSEEAARRWIDENYKRGGDVEEVKPVGDGGGYSFIVQLENLETGKWKAQRVTAETAKEAYAKAEKLHPGFIAQGVQEHSTQRVGDDQEMPHNFAYGDKGNCKYCGKPKSDAAHQAKTYKEYQTPVKRTADIQGFEIREKLGISESDWNSLSKEERQMKAREAVGRAKDAVCPVCEGYGNVEGKEKRERCKACNGTGLSRATDEVMPVGIVSVKPSSPVPMPTENDDKQRYAAADGFYDQIQKLKQKQLALGPHGSLLKKEEWNRLAEQIRKLENKKFATPQKRATDRELSIPEKHQLRIARETVKNPAKALLGGPSVEEAKEIIKRLTGRATDMKATLPLQTYGSEPKDHMTRAVTYEIAGDRARALDSYRAAASGYRKAAALARTGDEARASQTGEAKAREGVAACQTAFASHYEHPSRGRVKVCDSADAALRTAIERTRAGERVAVSGTTVRPAK